MSNYFNEIGSTFFTVINVTVPTFRDGFVSRPCTVAVRRTGQRTLKLGMAICNLDLDEFNATEGRNIALGRLEKRPITVTSEARTLEGIERVVVNNATVASLWNTNRR